MSDFGAFACGALVGGFLVMMVFTFGWESQRNGCEAALHAPCKSVWIAK